MCSHKCESSDAADYNIGILANGTIEFAFKLCPLSLWEREWLLLLLLLSLSLALSLPYLPN